MKTLFILALLTLAGTDAVAQLDTTRSQCSEHCQQQQQPWQKCQQQQQPWPQRQQQMEPCVQFLRHQCSTVTLPFVQSRMWQLNSCHIMRHQCCQQLAQIPEQFRCQAIHSVAQAIKQPQPQQQAPVEIMRMSLQTLPSICNVYVRHSATATASLWPDVEVDGSVSQCSGGKIKVPDMIMCGLYGCASCNLEMTINICF